MLLMLNLKIMQRNKMKVFRIFFTITLLNQPIGVNVNFDLFILYKTERDAYPALFYPYSEHGVFCCLALDVLFLCVLNFLSSYLNVCCF